MENVVLRAGLEPTHLAFRASVLPPLHHVGPLMSPLYPTLTCVCSSLPHRSEQTSSTHYPRCCHDVKPHHNLPIISRHWQSDIPVKQHYKAANKSQRTPMKPLQYTENTLHSWVSHTSQQLYMYHLTNSVQQQPQNKTKLEQNSHKQLVGCWHQLL